MSQTEYEMNLRLAYSQAGILAIIPIPDMINAINRAESVGPFLDPTLFMKNMDKMREDKKLLEALLPIWKLINKIKLESSTKASNIAPGIVAISEELSGG